MLLLSRLQSEDGDAAGALEYAAQGARGGAELGRSAQRLCPDVARRRRTSARDRHTRCAEAHLPERDAVSLSSRGRADARRATCRAPSTHCGGGAARTEPRADAAGTRHCARTACQLYADAKPFLARAVEPRSGGTSTRWPPSPKRNRGWASSTPPSKHVQQVLAKAPDHATANLVAGLIAMDRSQYADARAAFERAVRRTRCCPRRTIS